MDLIKVKRALNIKAPVVDATGFEPAAPTSLTWCSTKLSHASNREYNNTILYFMQAEIVVL